MVKRIVNGRIVDDDRDPNARPAQPPVDVFGGGLNFDRLVALLKHPFAIPHTEAHVPGFLLAALVAIVCFSWGLGVGLVAAAVVYFMVVAPQIPGNQPQQLQQEDRGKNGNTTNFNPNFSGSSVTNTQPRGSPGGNGGGGQPIDESKLREMRARKFGGIGDVRDDKM